MNRDRIKVLFVNDHLGYPGGVIHGATRYFLNVLPRLNRDEIDLKVCFFRERHPAAEQLEAAGICPIFLNRRKWDLRVLRDLIHLVREHDADILHLNGMKGCLLGRCAARVTGRHAIIHLHDVNPPGLVTGFLQRRVARSRNSLR